MADAAGIWLDNFSSRAFDIGALEHFLRIGKRVVLVSPELHGFEYEQYWSQLLEYMNSNPTRSTYIGICTDSPLKAREFFRNVE